MSQNIFDKSRKEFNKAIKELNINSLFTTEQFKNVYQATFGSLLIVGAGVGISIALSFMTTILSMLLAAMALSFALISITGILPTLKDVTFLELAVVCLSIALLTPVVPYVAILASAGLALFKSKDLLAPIVQPEQKGWLSSFSL